MKAGTTERPSSRAASASMSDVLSVTTATALMVGRPAGAGDGNEFLDAGDDGLANGGRGAADGIANRFTVRPSVRDDAVPRKPNSGRAAIVVVIDAARPRGAMPGAQGCAPSLVGKPLCSTSLRMTRAMSAAAPSANLSITLPTKPVGDDDIGHVDRRCPCPRRCR